jgi:hypothetical protein
MLPALPIANLVAENMAAVMPLLQQHMELSHNLRLAGMIKEITSQTTAAITERQLEAVLTLAKQCHDSLDANLQHYMAEQAKYSDLARSSADPMLRQEMGRHVTNIDFQMKRVRRDMETLQRFSGKLIAACGEMGLRFAHDVACRIK